MGNIFAASEIVEIGIQIEKNGRDFYSTLAAKSKSAKSQEVFKFLSGEEEKHLKVFEGILSQLEQYQPPESYPGEYFAYMNSLASKSVFTQKDQGKEIARKLKSDLEAIEIGIQAEKDSIIFYEGMKKVVPEFDQKVVDEIIAQEKGHLKMLLEIKEKI